MKEEYWTTKEGKKIAVGDMDIEHLRNTLRMLLRKRESELYYDDNRGEVYSGGWDWWK